MNMGEGGGREGLLYMMVCSVVEVVVMVDWMVEVEERERII